MQIFTDKSKRYQTFEGFGASGAWWAQEVGGWEHLDPVSGKPVRERISELLFSEKNGIGLQIYRYNIGAGSAQSGRGNIENRLRRTESFSLGSGYDWSSDANAVYMMKQAVKDGADEVIMFVNSPPEFLTKNGMAHTDKNKPFTDNLSRRNYRSFARFCLDITEHFISEGVPVKYLSPVNEPFWIWNGGQEGCHYHPRDISVLFKVFCDELRRCDSLADLKLSGAENGDIRWFNKSYTRCLFKNKDVCARLNGVDVHSYCLHAPLAFMNDREAYLRRFRRWMDKRYPGVPVRTSEWTHMKGGRDRGMDSALETAKVIVEDITLLNVASWQHWIAVSEVDYCDGLIYINLGSKTFEMTKRYYVTGNFSRFIRRGAVRIACECEDSRLTAVAFDCGAQTAVVVINPSAEDIPASLGVPKAKLFVTDNDRSLAQSDVSGEIIIPARSVCTVTF